MKRVKDGEAKDEDESPWKKKRLCPRDAVLLFENQILTNPLLTDAIFGNISYSDLLNGSLVSKSWNKTCRGILVNHSETYLKLSDSTTVEKLADFCNLICNVIPEHPHPVNGIWLGFNHPVQELPLFLSESFADVLGRIMEELEVKFVRLSMSRLHLKHSDFHEIFKKLVIPHLGTLQFLTVDGMHGLGNLNTLTQQLNEDSMPQLKKLSLGQQSQDRIKISTFKRLLRACPNLKEFPYEYLLPYQLPTLRLTNQLHLAADVMFNYMRLTPNDIQLLDEYGGLIKRLRLVQESKRSKNRFEGDCISRLGPIFSSELKHSLEFLRVEVELLVGILLQNNPFSPLTMLKELHIYGSQLWFPSVFKNGTAHFAELFPNLKSLTLLWNPYKSKWLESKFGNETEDGPLSLYQRSNSGSLESVQALTIVGSDLGGNEKFETLVKVMDLDKAFPSVTYLQIDFQHSELEDLLKWICESWGDLLSTLILEETECSRLMPYPKDENDEESVPFVGPRFLAAMGQKRTALPAGIHYSDKLSRLRRLELNFHHRVKGICEWNYEQERDVVRTSFKPRDGEGDEVELLISGCRASKRMSRVKCGISVYDTILALHPCPQDLELSLMEEIIGTESICKNICQMFTVQDLLRVSLVSRRWSVAARKELHQSRSCTLTINPFASENTKITGKINWLATREVKLFSCLKIIAPRSIRLFPTNNASSAVQANTLLLENIALKQTRFKVLELSGFGKPKTAGNEDNHSSDQDIKQLSTLVQNFHIAILQRLELDQVETLVASIETFEKFFRDDGGNLLVPNLKSIKFTDPEKLLDHAQVINRLLGELNFLERMENPLSNKLLPHFSSVSKAHVVKHLQLYQFPENEALIDGGVLVNEPSSGAMFMNSLLSPNRSALGFLLDFIQRHQPHFESLAATKFIQVYPKNELDLKTLFQPLLDSSDESLKSLRLSPSLLQLISTVYTRPLVSVSSLDLHYYDQGSYDPDRLLSTIPFDAMLPNLEVVSLVRCVLSRSDSIPKEQLSSKTAQVNSPQPCVSVKSLRLMVLFRGSLSQELHDDSINPESWYVENVARVFPQVNDFLFRIVFDSTTDAEESGREFTKILGSLWKSWPSLETIKISTSSLDAVWFEPWLLGISEVEWSLWKELQEDGSVGELLSTMHYAASAFSYRNCNGLKECLISSGIKTILLKSPIKSGWKCLSF